MESSLDFAALRASLFAHVENYEQLEALRLLYRSSGGLTAAEVGSELKVEAREAEQVSRAPSEVHARGARCYRRGRCLPLFAGHPELSSNVQLLMTAYEEDRVRLVELMTANAIERMRTTALRAFADGFRFGGPKRLSS